MYPQTGFPQALGYILVFLLREILGAWLVLQVQLGPFALLLENRLLLLCPFHKETHNVFLDSSNAECCPDGCSIPFFLEWTISHHLHHCFPGPTSIPSHCATEVAPLLSPLSQYLFTRQTLHLRARTRHVVSRGPPVPAPETTLASVLPSPSTSIPP